MIKANTINVEIASAEGKLHSGEATISVAATGGEIGIACRQTALQTTLNPGEVRVQTEGEEELLFWVSGEAVQADCEARQL